MPDRQGQCPALGKRAAGISGALSVSRAFFKVISRAGGSNSASSCRRFASFAGQSVEARRAAALTWRCTPVEAASLHRLKPNYANRTVPDLYRIAIGEHLYRLFCLLIVRARQGVPIENVALGREDKYMVLLHDDMITSAATPAIRATKLATASDTNARSIPSMPFMDHRPLMPAYRASRDCGRH